jgi:hypothetical protein
MYEIGVLDKVEVAADLPQPETAAPMPMVIAGDVGTVILIFYARPSQSAPAESQELNAVVRFDGSIAHSLGEPNDEALSGHPLFARGLSAYGAFRVRQSSWVATLERMNRVHSQHKPTAYQGLTHFVYTFHDSVFECVARSALASLSSRSRAVVIQEAVHQ